MGFGDLLGGIVGVVGSGGITGIIGGALHLLFGWLNTRAEIDKMKVQAQLQIDLVNANAAAKAKEYAALAQVEKERAEGIAAKADAEALAKSHEAAGRSLLAGVSAPEGPGFFSSLARGIVWVLLGIMEAIRAFIRPGLTVYLAAITTFLYFEANKLVTMLGVEWRQDIAEKIYVQIVFTILYLFGVCVSWWFMTRKVPNIMNGSNK